MAVGHRDPPAGEPAAPAARRRGRSSARHRAGGGGQVLLAVEYGDIGAALARLSPEMRAVIQAVVLDGLTTGEAARLLKCR